MEAFLIQARGLTSSAAMASLVSSVLRSPSLYFFADLFDVPNVSRLLPADDAALLQLFCYGTYGEYKSSGSFKKLDDASLMKLKALSLVSLAAAASVLPYADLQAALDLASFKDVEALVVQLIYAGLITVSAY
jgi:hypothetical protein